MPPNPTIIFVPGSFSGPFIFDKIRSVLLSPPHSLLPDNLIYFTLPSATPTRPEGAATLTDDSDALRALITSHADQDAHITLVLASYGGFPGTQAAFDLNVTSRRSAGKPGGITALVYLAAYMPSAGDSVVSLLGHSDPFAIDGYMPFPVYTEQGGREVFGDLEEEAERREVWERMVSHSVRSVTEPLREEGWRGVKCVYLLPEGDMCIKPELQREYVARVREKGARVEVLVRPWSHAPMLGREREIAEIIVAAGVEG